MPGWDRYGRLRDYPSSWNDIGRTLGNVVFVIEYGLLGWWFCRSRLGLGRLRLRRCTSCGHFLYYPVPILRRYWLCSCDLGDGGWLGLDALIGDALGGAFEECRTHHL
ncbi:zinc ribbon domain-containing protein [Stutzerimonas kunmingensis]|uniref:zinc ribbon domain-containing protein n=1 Tax=Stutzerimonas kunmingensis TaxID=1211807 RepID=UPI003B968D01